MRKRIPPVINLIPLVDLVLMLILFFFYAMREMSYSEDFDVTLPSVAGDELTEKDPYKVFLKKDDTICLRNFENCPTASEILRELSSHKTVLIIGHKKASLEGTLKLMKLIQQAQIKDVSFQTEQN